MTERYELGAAKKAIIPSPQCVDGPGCQNQDTTLGATGPGRRRPSGGRSWPSWLRMFLRTPMAPTGTGGFRWSWGGVVCGPTRLRSVPSCVTWGCGLRSHGRESEPRCRLRTWRTGRTCSGETSLLTSPARSCAGDVGDPRLIWPERVDMPFDEVGRALLSRCAACGARGLGASDSAQAQVAHGPHGRYNGPRDRRHDARQFRVGSASRASCGPPAPSSWFSWTRLISVLKVSSRNDLADGERALVA